MKAKILINTAFRSLQQHKARSFLTMLGVIIGIAAIISILAIGYGAEKTINERLRSSGNNFIMIYKWRASLGGETVKSTKQKPAKEISLDDVEIFKQQFPTSKVTPIVFSGGTINFSGTYFNTEVKGGNEHLLTILNRRIKKGTFFNKMHVDKSAKVIVLGAKAASELFKNRNPIGQIVTVKNINFTVIGILEKVENFFFEDPNTDTFIPYTTLKKTIRKDTGKNLKHVSVIMLSTPRLEDAPLVSNKITKILRARHRLAFDDPNDFTVMNQQSMAKAAQATSSILTLFLAIVAAIALLVGGIGVMNIMLVTVKERTREIGVRMALGATTRKILYQFLIEALALCFFGGLVGLFLGISIPLVVSHFTHWAIVIKPLSTFLAFCTIFVVGLVFGYYPARKASQLSPVEALRES